MQYAKAFFLSAVFFVSSTPLAFSKSETDQAQSEPRSLSGSQLSALTQQYHASSDLARPGIARSVARQLLLSEGEDGITRARANLVVSQNAAFDGRKDLALRSANQARQLALNTGDKGLLAQSAIALTRALILQEDYIEAVRTMAAARLAYGSMGEIVDPLWDELAMYEAISLIAVPSYLQSRGQSNALTPDQRLTLTGEKGARCGPAGVDGMGPETVGNNSGKSLTSRSGLFIERIENVGLSPFSDALYSAIGSQRGGVAQNLLSGDTGLRVSSPITAVPARTFAGIAVRSDLDAKGAVVRAQVTAHAPLQYFVAAGNAAAPTWQYRLPAGLDASCRQQILTVLAFKAR
jgi:hypothetical protein